MLDKKIGEKMNIFPKIIMLAIITFLLNGCFLLGNSRPYAKVKGPLTNKEYLCVFAGNHSDNPFYWEYFTFCGEKYRNECREYFIKQNPDLSREDKQLILKGKISKGFTKKQVVASWGEPVTLFYITDKTIECESCCYSESFSGGYKYCLGFEKGRLTSFYKGRYKEGNNILEKKETIKYKAFKGL